MDERAELLRRIDEAVAAGRMSEPDRQIRVAHVTNARTPDELDLLRRDLDRLLGVPMAAPGRAGRVRGLGRPTVRLRSTTVAGRIGWTTLTLLTILVLGMAVTVAFLAMRAVMEIGGTCASGGPYVVAHECPDGSWAIAVAVPVLIVMAMLGSYSALRVGAPNPLLVMWGALFGSLGWNFVHYGRRYDGEAGLLVVGGIFWLMALPAVLALIGWAVYRIRAAGDHRAREALVAVAWLTAYGVIGLVSVQFGAVVWARLT